MATSGHYYAALGIPHDASTEAIRTSYVALAKRYHPDLHAGDPTSANDFLLVTEAYEVLRDPQRRALYDEEERRKAERRYQFLSAAHAADKRARSSLAVMGMSAGAVGLLVIAAIVPFVWRPAPAPPHVPALPPMAEIAKADAPRLSPPASPAPEATRRLATTEQAAPRQRSIGPSPPATLTTVAAASIAEPLAAAPAQARQAPRPEKVGMLAPPPPPPAPLKTPMKIAPGESRCVSDEGTAFSIMSAGGITKVSYDGAPPARAKKAPRGKDILLLSGIVAGNDVQIGLIKGNKDETVVIFLDRSGKPSRSIGARCAGLSF